MTHTVRRIVSGGQTGADRAGLDVGLALGLDVGGWVPRGRAAEDGPIPARYPGLVESDSPQPRVRTSLNVRDADATLILSHGPLDGGSALTRTLASRAGKPCLHVDLDAAGDTAARTIRAWLDAERPATLNVAGPRASKDPGLAEAVRRVLAEALSGEDS